MSLAQWVTWALANHTHASGGLAMMFSASEVLVIVVITVIVFFFLGRKRK